MKRKGLHKWIRENRAEVDRVICRALRHVPPTASCDCPLSGTDHYHTPPDLTDEERRLWVDLLVNGLGYGGVVFVRVLNDEGLYNWALSEGVRL